MGRSLSSFLVSLGLLYLMLLGCSKKGAVTESSPSPTPVPLIPHRIFDTSRLFNGITVNSSIESTNVPATALSLESDSDSYQLQLELHLKIPQAANTSTNLLAATPGLDQLIPDFEEMVKNATVSPDFESLFAHKEKHLKANLGMLQRLLPRDTLYDCQTILNIEKPQAQTSPLSVILIQALMNVDTDGSDGDRNLEIPKPSESFQPTLNYRWPKASEHPNPYLAETAEQITLITEKLEDTSLSGTEREHLKSSLEEKSATLAELKRWSFLVGAADPFIVLPTFMFGKTTNSPHIGDYAIVISGDTLYPAIVGDKGPNFKIGEASLRICQEIDAKSTADRRPIDHPSVTYLVFPGSAEKPFTTPDYHHLSERCQALWKALGGSDSADWQEWTSLEKPWPTPTPSPSDVTNSSSSSNNFSDSNSTTGTNTASPVPQSTPLLSPSTNLSTSSLPSSSPSL